MSAAKGDLTPFLDGAGRLTALPAKHKKKLAALWYLAGKLQAGRQYSEPEINALLDEWTLFHDPATLYWKEESISTLEAFLAQYL